MTNREKLRDGLVKCLRCCDGDAGNIRELDREILALHTLKAEILKDWPWQDRKLPPVDRAMVARSRATIERGVRVEDLIRELEGHSPN